MPDVLLVDDDERLLRSLRRGLSLRGFEVALAYNADEALERFETRLPDIIVLDIMMPGIDGIGLCRLIRERSDVPILMLTARDSVPDRVTGLQAGADDYLIKPFAFDELVARIQALLRRTQPRPTQSGRLFYANLALDLKSWTASCSGKPLVLTAKEFRLLEHFMRNPEQVLTREDILTAVWGKEWADTESNVVEVHVAHLRQKLEATGCPRYIHTIRSVGYMLKRGE